MARIILASLSAGEDLTDGFRPCSTGGKPHQSGVPARQICQFRQRGVTSTNTHSGSLSGSFDPTAPRSSVDRIFMTGGD